MQIYENFLTVFPSLLIILVTIIKYVCDGGPEKRRFQLFLSRVIKCTPQIYYTKAHRFPAMPLHIHEGFKGRAHLGAAF